MSVKSIDSVACIILTKNEALNIGRCIRSVAWCDEVIVVDSGSSDKTTELSRSLGARVFINIPQGAFNIADQRNWALKNTGIASAWVLFMDADEEVTPLLKSELQHKVATAGALNCFELTPRYLFWGRWLKRTQGFPNWHARLLRRDAVAFEGGVWEHFDDRSNKGFVSEPYNHYANSKGFSDWLERHDRYSTWDAEKIVEFLGSQDPEKLGTKRKVRLRTWAARLYPLRPIVRFIHCYLIRGGFLEGKAGLVFALLYAFYELMTVIKVTEAMRQKRGESL